MGLIVHTNDLAGNVVPCYDNMALRVACFEYRGISVIFGITFEHSVHLPAQIVEHPLAVVLEGGTVVIPFPLQRLRLILNLSHLDG